jgi:hypothetical protein
MSDEKRHILAIVNYAMAWNSPDAAKRRELLQEVFADDGVFVDRLDHKIGREELLEHMAAFHRDQPGNRFENASGFDIHHGHHRFVWRMRNAEGEVLREATNFGEVDEAGRITKMADFFGPPPVE